MNGSVVGLGAGPLTCNREENTIDGAIQLKLVASDAQPGHKGACGLGESAE